MGKSTKLLRDSLFKYTTYTYKYCSKCHINTSTKVGKITAGARRLCSGKRSKIATSVCPSRPCCCWPCFSALHFVEAQVGLCGKGEATKAETGRHITACLFWVSFAP